MRINRHPRGLQAATDRRKLVYGRRLVSNLPAWTFDDERSTDRDALTAAIEISVGGVERSPQVGWTIGSAIRTMIFGSGILNKRGVDRLTSERLVVDLGLLDFDIGRARAAEIVQKTETFCDGSLIARMIELPRSINDMCEAVSLKCHEFIEAAFDAAASPVGNLQHASPSQSRSDHGIALSGWNSVPDMPTCPTKGFVYLSTAR